MLFRLADSFRASLRVFFSLFIGNTTLLEDHDVSITDDIVRSKRSSIIFLVLRRMRIPLLILLISYVISVLGMVLIPGQDSHGNEIQIDFFEAFYFVSYMATTIGFGELPYEFTSGQRMWVLISIYLTVISWLYAIGKILTLIQDGRFQQAVREHQFARSVNRIREPFYLICGYGDIGKLLIKMMTERNMLAVIIDKQKEVINELELEDHFLSLPAYSADASATVNLDMSGLTTPYCRAIVALTDSDEVNLKVAITARLLRPDVRVICRSETHDYEANMASFGTEHIINPFDIFAERLSLAIHSPGSYLLYEWVTGIAGDPLPTPLYPKHGTWIVCGYGRFGKAVYQDLVKEGIDVTIIEMDPNTTQCKGNCIHGRGTEANTLLSAGILNAVGIVAGTDNDSNNLSIMITARELNPHLFFAARQNRHENSDLFQAAKLDLVMRRAEIIARDIFAYLTNPALKQFLYRANQHSNQWANQMVSRIAGVVGEQIPEVWSTSLSPRYAPAVVDYLNKGGTLTLAELLKDVRDSDHLLPIVPLYWRSADGLEVIEPEMESVLELGDKILFCAARGQKKRLERVLYHSHLLEYVIEGRDNSSSWLLNHLFSRNHQQKLKSSNANP